MTTPFMSAFECCDGCPIRGNCSFFNRCFAELYGRDALQALPAVRRRSRRHVLLEAVEVFAPGDWKGGRYDAMDIEQAARMFSYVRDNPSAAKTLGCKDGGAVPVVLGHDESAAVGEILDLYTDDGAVLVADMQVVPEAARAIRDGELVGVSAALSFDMLALRLRHVALLAPGIQPAVFGLRPIGECLPREYAE